jgi:hypothetical protein
MEAFLIALIEAIAQGLAAAIAPLAVQQVQQPSTAQDGYSDAELQAQLKAAIENPAPAD